jgi:two-component system NarL family sensor kinase
MTDPPSRLAGLISTRAYTAINLAVIVACVAVAVVSSSAADWHRLGLIAVLLVFVLLSEFSGVAFGPGTGSVSTPGVTLAMAFLAPSPALVIAAVPVAVESLHRRVSREGLVGNVALYSAVGVGGSLLVGAIFGRPPDVSMQTLLFVVGALALCGEYVTHFYVDLTQAVILNVSLRAAMRRSLFPLVPFQLVSAAFTGAAAVVYVSAGLGALAALLAALILSVRLVQTVAEFQAREQQVAELAIARARLLGEALTAEERERVRLAGEIHDDALQELALAQLELHGAANRHLEAGIAAIRRTLSRMVPAAETHGGGLAGVLEATAAGLCEPAGLKWSVSVDPALDGADPTLVASIARELVTNAVKHAEASTVAIAARRSGSGVRLEVRDDGHGFARDGDNPSPAGHFGLALVENRARAADGRLEVRPAEGGGSVVAVELGGFA